MSRFPVARWVVMLAMLVSVGSAKAQEAETPTDVLRKALEITRKAAGAEDRYTFTETRHSSTYDTKGRLVGESTREYEMTWIGEQPYLRLKAVGGALLKGKDLEHETKLYDEAVASHNKLGLEERSKLIHMHLVNSGSDSADALSNRYTVRAVKNVKTHDGEQRVLVAEPKPDAKFDGCRWRYVFWLALDSPTLLHEKTDVLDDPRPHCVEAHLDTWFKVIDGMPRPYHSESHYWFVDEKKKDSLMDAANSYVDYRRFRASVKLVPDTTDEAPATTPPLQRRCV